MTREEAIQVIRANGLYYVPQNTPVFEMLIDAFDMAIEALKQPERKTGKWIDLNATDRYKRVKVYDHFECPVCHARSSNDSKYCPNCGSYNGGDEDD